MANFFDNGGFHWWTGVVEDRNDPLFLGRCRVRIVGYHNSDTAILPVEDLPWATMVQPITSAAMTGIGESPLGPVEGTWVVGFFADGKDNQEPMVFGTLGGIPQKEYYKSIPKTQGFQDPNKVYPITELLNEPDTNRLARGIREPFVKEKNTNRITGIPLARNKGSWSEPKSPYAAIYPFNHVSASESGHIQEIDDTPDAERLNSHHKAGTYTEIDRNGTRVTRIVGDNYEILERNGFLYIKGKMNVTVDGTSNIYVKGNCNLEVDGSMQTDVHGNYNLNVANSLKISAGGGIQVKSVGAMRLQGLTFDAKSKTALRLQAGTFVGIKSTAAMMIEAGAAMVLKAVTVAADAVFKQKNLSINPAPIVTLSGVTKALVGSASSASVPKPVSSKSPTEPSFPNLGFALTKEQKKAFKIEAFRAQEAANDKKMTPTGRQVAQEYADLKNEEVASNAVVSAPVVPDEVSTTPVSQEYACSSGSLVVEIAKKDLGVLETNTPPGKNYGGKVGGGTLPPGVFGRIDEMCSVAGLDNPAEVRRKGEGYYWCAAAVATWWKEAGLPIPRGAASCRNWESWGRREGYFSDTPKIGAAILYGTSGAAHHIGIVAAIDENGTITTIEGNTSGGAFNRNGCGVFYKTPRSYIGFILPPTCV